ncbi:MAG: hypothetical protein MJZ34_02435 [Paludibacteraceae bacterium]|nr:hypothetical protein [Paludibacteraceae bacterium]
MKRELTKEEKELAAKIKKLFGKKMKKGLTTREIAEVAFGESNSSTIAKTSLILKSLAADEKNGLKYTANPEGSKRPGLWSRSDVEPAFEGAVKSHKSTKKAEEKPAVEEKAPKAAKVSKPKVDDKDALITELEGLTKQLIQRAADADPKSSNLTEIVAAIREIYDWLNKLQDIKDNWDTVDSDKLMSKTLKGAVKKLKNAKKLVG